MKESQKKIYHHLILKDLRKVELNKDWKKYKQNRINQEKEYELAKMSYNKVWMDR